jgi:hypothetical protein
MTPEKMAEMLLTHDRDIEALKTSTDAFERVADKIHELVAKMDVFLLKLDTLATHTEKSDARVENELKELKESVDERFKTQGERIGVLQGKSGKLFDNAVSHLITVALGAIAMYLFSRLGL